MANQGSASGIKEVEHPEQGKNLRTYFLKKSKRKVRSQKEGRSKKKKRREKKWSLLLSIIPQ